MFVTNHHRREGRWPSRANLFERTTAVLGPRYSLEIRHTRAHVPLFRLSLTARLSAVILSSGTEELANL